jgi:hypothetical protein
MNTPMNPIPRVLVLLAALGAFGSAQLQSQAPKSQSKSPANSSSEGLVLLTFTTVKPDRVSEFERLQKEELNPAFRKAGVTMRFASTRATVGEGYTYVFGTPLKNFAELDQENWVTKALGREKAAALIDKLRSCQVASRTVVVRNIPDLSWGLDTPMPYFVVTSIQLVNGKKEEWLKYQREVAPAQRKSGLATYVVQETIYGGDNNLVYTLRRFDRFADLDSNPLRQHMGEEAYNALVAKRPTEAVVRFERTLARHRTDLSIVPEAKPKAAR